MDEEEINYQGLRFKLTLSLLIILHNIIYTMKSRSKHTVVSVLVALSLLNHSIFILAQDSVIFFYEDEIRPLPFVDLDDYLAISGLGSLSELNTPENIDYTINFFRTQNIQVRAERKPVDIVNVTFYKNLTHYLIDVNVVLSHTLFHSDIFITRIICSDDPNQNIYISYIAESIVGFMGETNLSATYDILSDKNIRFAFDSTLVGNIIYPFCTFELMSIGVSFSGENMYVDFAPNGLPLRITVLSLVLIIIFLGVGTTIGLYFLRQRLLKRRKQKKRKKN